MDRLASMEVFAKVVEAGSFTAAAKALAISAPMVGKHIRMLEDHLGVRLLNRTTRRQSVTDIGRNVYERTKTILAEVDAAEALVAESRAAPRGQLRINAPVTFGAHELAKVLPEYLAAHPEVTVNVTLTDRLVDLIDEGYDAIFRGGPLADSGLIARPLQPFDMVVCAAPDYLARHGTPKQPHDLRDHECLGFAYWASKNQWTFQGPNGKVSVEVSGRLVVNSGQALLTAALAGSGIVLQPAALVHSDLEAGRLVRLLPNYLPPSRPMHILYAPDRRITPKLRSFIEFALAKFGPARPNAKRRVGGKHSGSR